MPVERLFGCWKIVERLEQFGRFNLQTIKLSFIVKALWHHDNKRPLLLRPCPHVSVFVWKRNFFYPFLKRSTSTREQENGVFEKFHFGDRLRKVPFLVQSVKKRWVFKKIQIRVNVASKNVLTAVVKYTKNHKRKFEQFSLGLVKRLFQGMKVRVPHYGLNDQDTEDVIAEWETNMNNLKHGFYM